MPAGGYYIQEEGLEELKQGLEGTARGTKDLSKVFGQLGRKAGLYVMAHEPIYAGPTKGRTVTIHLQDHTKGGGGKTAWASVSGVPYLYVQEFGGTSYWHAGGAGAMRKMNRGHRAVASFSVGGTHYMRAGGHVVKGHAIYEKPRKTRGYFLWNVWFTLRSMVGRDMTTGLADIAKRNNLAMSVDATDLGIEQTSGPVR